MQTDIERVYTTRELVFESSTESNMIRVGGTACCSVYLPPEFSGSALTIEVNVEQSKGKAPVWKKTGQQPITVSSDTVNVITPQVYEIAAQEIRFVSTASEKMTGLVFLST